MYGRIYELDLLRKAIASRKAELGVVYGRRRIGKSTLLKSPLGMEALS
jgi:AAA+ ATPase superfamily predicted ATPase